MKLLKVYVPGTVCILFIKYPELAVATMLLLSASGALKVVSHSLKIVSTRIFISKV